MLLSGIHFLPRFQALLGKVCFKNHCLEYVIAKRSFANVAFPTMTFGGNLNFYYLSNNSFPVRNFPEELTL